MGIRFEDEFLFLEKDPTEDVLIRGGGTDHGEST
jgi:hypothetical protein